MVTASVQTPVLDALCTRYARVWTGRGDARWLRHTWQTLAVLGEVPADVPAWGEGAVDARLRLAALTRLSDRLTLILEDEDPEVVDITEGPFAVDGAEVLAWMREHGLRPLHELLAEVSDPEPDADRPTGRGVVPTSGGGATAGGDAAAGGDATAGDGTATGDGAGHGSIGEGGGLGSVWDTEIPGAGGRADAPGSGWDPAGLGAGGDTGSEVLDLTDIEFCIDEISDDVLRAVLAVRPVEELVVELAAQRYTQVRDIPGHEDDPEAERLVSYPLVPHVVEAVHAVGSESVRTGAAWLREEARRILAP